MSVIFYTETKHLKIIISPAKEEDEVPYYTGRKDLAHIEDATVDTEDNEKTLIKRYGFLCNDSVFCLSHVFFLMDAQTIVKSRVGVARRC